MPESFSNIVLAVAAVSAPFTCFVYGYLSAWRSNSAFLWGSLAVVSTATLLVCVVFA